MKRSLVVALALLLGAASAAHGQGQPPPNMAPPSNLQAVDFPWDNGGKVKLTWDLSPDDAEVETYVIYQSVAEVGGVPVKPKFGIIDSVPGGVSEYVVETVPEMTLSDARTSLGDRIDIDELDVQVPKVTFTAPKFHVAYLFQVQAMAPGRHSVPVTLDKPVTPVMQPFDVSRFWLMVITVVFCGAVVYWINHARKGRPIRVRQIAGLEAVDEAVGRATEMGRPCLYIPGILDINDIQTIASMTILSRVSRTAAEYDAKVEVPTSKSLVMTTARETVQAAFLAAGRPDAYNQDLIYYVTDEQFGYVAYLQGLMVREKPAACFYMGAFFAESLILAETGNSIGAIQVAGTAMPAQLPFFVAACDYTLIGEEFFAASAYLSGSPEELGSLKGQDVGKVIVFFLLIIGVAAATLAAMTGSVSLERIVTFLRHTMLT